ncbi:hypothetical protein F66182_8718 [Fusarium sp. NRRL 66182]|nr:hypothetical protein F66182_8718 [Fusarium sp. NRRL 66182]
MTQAIIAGFIALLVLFIYTVIKQYLAGLRPKNFPPGPPTVPFLAHSGIRWTEWKKSYGDVLGLKLAGRNVVILNSWRGVREYVLIVPVTDKTDNISLMDKRGAVYSSRLPGHIIDVASGGPGFHLLLSPYGNAWRKQRKVLQGLLSITAVDKALPVQSAEASSNLYLLLKEPKDWYNHIRRYSTAVILATVYAQRGLRFEARRVRDLYDVQDRFSFLLERTHPPVDDFPILKYLPEFLAPWKKEAREIRRDQKALFEELYYETKAKMEEQEMDCFMAKMIKDFEKNGLEEAIMAQIGGIFMEAGSDTTAGTLLAWVVAMAKYPEVQKKAQKELDAVCGSSRSPTPEDISELHYVRACVTETLRWRPIAPGGIPHATTEDDTYNGHFIPKDTVVIANIWAIHHDEEIYDRPEEFIPERFLNNKYGTREEPTPEDAEHRRQVYTFGGGRRVCPGQHLAVNSLIINTAKMLWAFDIVPEDPNIDVNVETAFTEGAAIAPYNCPINFNVRSPQHAALIEKEMESMKEFLDNFDVKEE